MNNKDVDAMIAAAKASGGVPNSQDIPILGQQARIMHGIPVNGGLITINELEKMPERAFRELVLGIFVNLIGGVYVPPTMPAAEDVSEEANPVENPHDNNKEKSPDN